MVKTVIRSVCNEPILLDSSVHGNDGYERFYIFYALITFSEHFPGIAILS